MTQERQNLIEQGRRAGAEGVFDPPVDSTERYDFYCEGYSQGFMDIGKRRHSMDIAYAQYKANPSANNWSALESAMIAFQTVVQNLGSTD